MAHSNKNKQQKLPFTTTSVTTPNINTSSTVESSVFSPLQSLGIVSAATTPGGESQQQQQQQERHDTSGLPKKHFVSTTTQHNFLHQLTSSSRTSLSPSPLGNQLQYTTKDQESMGESSLSDISQLEDAVEFYEAQGPSSFSIQEDGNFEEGTKTNHSSKSVSIFRELEEGDLLPSEDQKRQQSVNNLLEIYAQTSPVSNRESADLSKENTFSFIPSSSASLISSNRKLETKHHLKKKPKATTLKDLTNSTLDGSTDINSSSGLNFYKDNSTVSTRELLDVLMSDQPSRELLQQQQQTSTQHRTSSYYPSRSSGDQYYEFKDSLTNILEEINQGASNPKSHSFKVPLTPLNQVYKGRSPPASSASSGDILRALQQQRQQPQSHSQMNNYKVQQQDTHSSDLSEDRFIPVKPSQRPRAPSTTSNVSAAAHSFEEFDYAVVNNNARGKPVENPDVTIGKEKWYTGGSDDDGSLMLSHSQYEQQTLCPKRISKRLIICSLLIPPFYFFIALGVLDHKIGRIDRRHRMIAGMMSIVGTVLILLAIGLSFGYGLTHL